MSGLTLTPTVARGRHRKPTPNHVECVRDGIFAVLRWISMDAHYHDVLLTQHHTGCHAWSLWRVIYLPARQHADSVRRSAFWTGTHFIGPVALQNLRRNATVDHSWVS